MSWQTETYFSIVLVSFILSGVLAWQAWRQRGVPGSRFYFWLTVGMCWIAAGEALSMLAPTQTWALFWFKTRFLGFAAIPPLWLLFALEYNGKGIWITKWLAGGLFAIPILTQFFIWLPPLQGLWVTREVGFSQDGPLWVADISQRVPALFYLFYNLTFVLLMLSGSVLLLRAAWHQTRLFRWQAALLAASALVPVIASLVSTFNLLPAGVINPTLPAMVLAALLAATAIYRFDFLKQTPAQAGQETRQLDAQGKRSLAFLLLIFGFLAAAIAAFAIISYQSYQEKFQTQVENQLLSIAELKINDLASWHNERMGDGNLLRQNPALAALVQRFLNDPADTSAAAPLQTWLDSLRGDYQYDQVFLLDTTGTERMSSPVAAANFERLATAQEPAILQSGQVTFLDLHSDSPGGSVHMTVLVPLYAGGDLSQPLGLLGLRMLPQTYLYPYLEQWPVPSDTAETLLVRRDGADVLFLVPLRFRPDAALNLRMPLSQTDVLAVKAVLGQTGVARGIDYRGVAVIGAIKPVPGTPWFLVARIDQSEVDSPLQQRMWETLGFYGALLLACGAGLLALWRQQNLRFYRAEYKNNTALRASEETYRLLVQNLQAGIVVHGPDTRVLFANEQACRLLGVSLDQIMGKADSDSTWRFVDEDGNPAPLEEYPVNRVLSSQKPIKDLIGGIQRKGPNRLTWIMINGYPEFEDNGRIHQVVITLIDITARKEFEAALRESEDKFKYIFDNSIVGNSITLPSGEVSPNKAFCDMLGYTAEELASKNWREFSHPNDIPLNEAITTSIIHGKIDAGRFEKRYFHKNGSIVWVDIRTSLRRDTRGKPLYFMSTIVDITARKIAEEILQSSEKQLLEAQELARLGSYRLDFRTNLWVSSAVLDELFGIDETFERSVDGWLAIIHVDDRKQMTEFFYNEVIGKHMPFDREYQITRQSDGNVRWVHGLGKLEVDDQDRLTTMIGTIQDITERKKAEESLRQLMEELKRSNAELEQFAYVASHDLQEPLRMVSSYLQLLERRYRNKLDENANEFIDFAVDGAVRMQRLINDLLAYSRLNTRVKPFAQVDVTTVLNLSLGNLQVAISENQAVITHDPLPEVWGDENQLVQLFQNLLGNAIKFHGTQSPRVHISAMSFSPESPYPFPATTEKQLFTEGYVFSIKDNGIGLDLQYAERIFIIFQRLHGRQEYVGTGIGLAICKKIIQRHGGSIWVESQPGQGATFYFALPKPGEK